MIDIMLGAAAVGVTVEYIAPWIVEQQIRLEQYLEQRELEQQLDYEIRRSGDLVLPTVIVTPMGEDPEPVRQRLIIQGDQNAE